MSCKALCFSGRSTVCTLTHLKKIKILKMPKKKHSNPGGRWEPSVMEHRPPLKIIEQNENTSTKHPMGTQSHGTPAFEQASTRNPQHDAPSERLFRINPLAKATRPISSAGAAAAAQKGLQKADKACWLLWGCFTGTLYEGTIPFALPSWKKRNNIFPVVKSIPFKTKRGP